MRRIKLAYILHKTRNCAIVEHNKRSAIVVMDGNLRRLRERKAISRRDLAERAHVDDSTIYRLEMGRTRRPVPRTLRKLATALGVDVEEITSMQGHLGV